MNDAQLNAHTAHVIALGNRFFVKFDKAGRVQTAWSLAGATLFGGWRDELTVVFDKLQASGKKPVLLSVGVIAPVVAV